MKSSRPVSHLAHDIFNHYEEIFFDDISFSILAKDSPVKEL